MRILYNKKISLLVADMTGTILNDKKIFYNCIAQSLEKLDYSVDKREVLGWSGKSKNEILHNHISKFHSDLTDISPQVFTVSKLIDEAIDKAYFSKNSEVELFPDVSRTLERLNFYGMKIALTTCQSKSLQSKVVNKFGLYSKIDTFISKDDVRKGRPYPYMIYRAMEDNLISDVKKVAKVGDTKFDLIEGKNAGCRLNIGVATGVCSKRELNYYSKSIIDTFSEL